MAAPLMSYDPSRWLGTGNTRQKLSDPGYDPMEGAKPAQTMGKPAIPSGKPAMPPNGKPVNQGGASMLPEPTGMTVDAPQPMPVQGGAGWNDISRYQPGMRRDSGMPTPRDPVANAVGGLSTPSGIGGVSRTAHRMAGNGVGSALVGGLTGQRSANNQRYRQVANAGRNAQATQNQIQQLTANGRTYDQALDELGLRGSAMWDESARVARPRGVARQLPGGGDRTNRYMP